MILPPPDDMTLREAVLNLRRQISLDKGHGMPRFVDRAGAYVAIAHVDTILNREDASYTSEFIRPRASDQT